MSSKLAGYGVHVSARGTFTGRPNSDLLGKVVVAERQEVAGNNAHKSMWRIEDYADFWVVINKNLPIPPARAFHASVMISNGHNVS